jgi:predicted nucleic acid-binding protein
VLDLFTSGGFAIAEDRPVSEEVLLLARYRQQVKTSDACVLALATLPGRPVLTLDKRLVSAAVRVGLSVVEEPQDL